MNFSNQENVANKSYVDAGLRAPLVLIIFNRPRTTQPVFESIRHAKPKRLFIIADGPREDREHDIALVAQTRKIVENVDWSCDVTRIYSECNLGCRDRVSSGLTEVFNQVDRAIILEDDCLPDPSFFSFCDLLLDLYKDDTRVSSIAGTSMFPFPAYKYSYAMSKYPQIWGWATWARCWKYYDRAVDLWRSPIDRHEVLKCNCTAVSEYQYWFRAIDGCINGQLNSWDYVWLLACWMQKAMHVIPKCNLVSNIGFGPDATHTKGDVESEFQRTSLTEMIHPNSLYQDLALDRRLEVEFYGSNRTLSMRTINRLVRYYNWSRWTR